MLLSYPDIVSSQPLEIHYVFHDGSYADEIYTEDIPAGQSFSVSSPNISCYVPDVAVVEGDMPVSGAVYTVTYTAKERSFLESFLSLFNF